MTPPDDQKPLPPDPTEEPEQAEEMREPQDSQDSEAIRALLKRSIDVGSTVSQSTDLLGGVQKKLRLRSKGKFYADGWSTTQSRINYMLVAIAMLIVIAVAYFALGPTGIAPH